MINDWSGKDDLRRLSISATCLLAGLVAILIPDRSLCLIGGRSVLASDPISRVTVAINTSAPGEPENICTGTIISDQLVITAAHCRVMPGNTLIFAPDPAAPNVVTRVIAETEANAYRASGMRNGRPSKNQNDIEILYFKGGLPPGYQSARLCGQEELRSGNFAVTAGYGDTKINESGVESLHKGKFLVANLGYSRTEIQLAVSPESHSMAGGDSGGPAFKINKNGLCLAGVDNWGWDRSDEPGPYYEIYASVLPYQKWILDFAARITSRRSL